MANNPHRLDAPTSTFVVQTPVDSSLMRFKLGHILRTSRWDRNLPLQFNSTQVAAADALEIQMSRSNQNMTVASVDQDFIHGMAQYPRARPQALRTLGAALHLLHLRDLCKEMNAAGTSTACRADKFARMAEPLQRCRKTIQKQIISAG